MDIIRIIVAIALAIVAVILAIIVWGDDRWGGPQDIRATTTAGIVIVVLLAGSWLVWPQG